MTDVFETMVARAKAADPPKRSLRLLVDGAFHAFELPTEGKRVIGRSHDVEVHVAHATVSRRHAELTLEPTMVTIQDLGSVNGTRIGSRELEAQEPEDLRVGEVFGVGDAIGVVLEGGVDARPSRSVGREELAEAIERAIAFRHEGETFCVGTLTWDDAAANLDSVANLVPPRGHVAALGHSVVVVLLPSMSRVSATAWLDGVRSYFVRRGAELASRVTSCPDDGATLQALCPPVLTAGTTGITPRHLAPASLPPQNTLSPAMRKLHELVEQVAATPASVLILGETGVGKEVTAKLVHSRSNRANGPFVALNCAALPETLLESELFGYEKGAFTGAQAAKQGLIEAASGGTLFLDELGEMPLATQAKLLRVLEDRTVLRVGSVKPKAVDIRLLAATNRDLLEEIQAKRFRPDLYYRLNGIVLRIPPLRERKPEIKALASLFFQKAAEALSRPIPNVPADVFAALERYDWPGNVRELRNAVERLVLLAQSGTVAIEHLPDEVRTSLGFASLPPPAPPRPRLPTLSGDLDVRVGPLEATVDATIPPPSSEAQSLDDEIAQLERTKILDALDKCAGNQTRAAEMLGITRRVLIRKLEKYKLPRPRK